MAIKIITKNKKAYFNYEILDKLEAGIVLKGAEVKSIKTGQVNISNAFVKIENDEAWLWNADVAKYKFSSQEHYEPLRTRKLLLNRKEINKLISKTNQKGFTILPLMVYLSRGRVKVEIGLGRGKKLHEKKNKIKERELTRELHREKRSHMVN